MFSPIPLHFTPIEGLYQEPLRDVAARIWLTLRNIYEYASNRGKAAENYLALSYMPQFTEQHQVSEAGIAFIYEKPSGEQPCSAALARHTLALLLDLYAKELALISEAMGYRLQIPAEATAAIGDTLIGSIKTSLFALVAAAQNPNDCLILFDEKPESNPLALSEPNLSNAQRIKLLQQWHKRSCDCSLCKKISKNRAKLHKEYLYFFDVHQPPFANYFGSALRHPKQISTIDMISVGVSQIPETIDRCTALRTLSISNCFVRELPEALFRLPHLQHLSLFKNRLQSLPASIKALKGLLSLNISFNPIEELPQEIGEMERLANLVLSDCPQFRRLPAAFPNIARLEQLDLSNTAIEELPKWLEGAINLRALNLSHSAIAAKAIEDFPFQLLPKLKELSLKGLRLRRLPPALLDCANLEGLYIDDNEIEEIPARINQLQQLQRLEAGKNRIAHLPDSFCELSALTNFGLEGNPLQSLPENLASMPKLSWLRINSSVRIAALGHKISVYKV